MATRKEKAEVDGMRDKLDEMKDKVAELQKINSKEAKYQADTLKLEIEKLHTKYAKRLHEILLRVAKQQRIRESK